MRPYIHPNSNCQTDKIGTGTRIWGFTSIMKDVIIGDNCNICDFVFIETGVQIGNNVTVKCGVYLWTGIYIEDNVFIGPNVTFANDKYPQSRKRPEIFLKTTLRRGCSLGANSVILPGITIGENSLVGAGSVVTKDVEANSVVFGNPAKLQRMI